MRSRRRWICALVLAAACRDDGATDSPEATYSLVAPPQPVSGPAGSRLLSVPLAIVRDPSGTAVSGVAVTLSVASGGDGGFTLPEANAASGADGIVRADVQLGVTGEAQLRVAMSAGVTREVSVPVSITPAPALGAVAPTSFTAGDEVQLTGTGLPSEAGGATVLIGGVRATVLEATTTTLRVRAPACVASGEVPIVVSLSGGVTTNAVTATYASGAAAPSLQPFEAVTVSAERASECLSLLGGGARYLVVPQYATRDDVGSGFRDGARYSFTLGAPSTGAVASRAAALAEPLSAQARLDRALRLRERQLAPFGAAQGANPPLDAPPLTALELNSARQFSVLTDLDGDTFATVTGRLRFIGDDILVYVDEQAPANGLSAADLDGLGRLFDRKLAPAAVETFGAESDIDRNGHVVVLLTPEVNKLTPASACTTTGFVTGFFYGLDLLVDQRNSNKAEVFYALVPDPTGATSCRHSVDEILRLVPSTFIHEFQHMISWNQRVLVRGNRSDEELWLNEGLSHIAEEVASLLYEVECENVFTPPCRSSSVPTEQIFPDSSQGFIQGNYVNAFLYLQRSTDNSLPLFDNDGTLEERGAAFLFLRWLGDQKGTGIYRRLVETKLEGVANVEDKAGEPWERLFGDFSVAVYSADRLPDVDPNTVPSRYRFLSRDLRRIFKRFFDTGTSSVTRAFPIQETALNLDGTPAVSMVPGTMTWYLLTTTPATARAAVSMTAGTPPFPTALGAQVTILRLPD